MKKPLKTTSHEKIEVLMVIDSRPYNSKDYVVLGI